MTAALVDRYGPDPRVSGLVRTFRAWLTLIFVGVCVLVLCVTSHGPKVTVSSVRAQLKPYCAQFGQVPLVWSEVDSGGDVSVYGRCVKEDGDIARGA